MAKITQEEFTGQTDASGDNATHIDVNGQESIEVPSNEFIANASITRDGQDLVLEAPNGEQIIVNDYFMVEPAAPMIESPDGSILTENLINSFLDTPTQYAQTTSMTDESPVGAVEEVSGEATILRADGTSETATLGTPVYQGDIIETSGNGAVNIVFIDETSMAVSENARLAVDEYQFDPSTESGTTNLSVLRGVFVFTSGLIGRDDPDDVLIDTPVGSIGIRGTIIAGKINPGGESEITVVEGAIVVKNGTMEKTLSQQFESIKLGKFNDNMQELGVKDAEDINNTYGSVSDVVPKLFSSINDSVKEEVKTEPEKQDEPTEENLELNTEEVIEEENLESEILETPIEEQQFHNNHHNTVDHSINPAERRARSKIADHEHNRFKNPDFEQLDPRLFQGGENIQLPIIVSGAAGIDHVVTFGSNQSTTNIGDFNGDGDSDVAFLNPAGRVEVLDNGTSIFTGSGSSLSSFSAVGDTNNDGFSDVIAGSPFSNSGEGLTNLITGDNASPGQISVTGLAAGVGLGTTDNFGSSVTGIGDFDGDGKSDYAVGASGFDSGFANIGKVIINFGGGGSTDIDGHFSSQLLGTQVVGIGDINGDGFSDLLISGDPSVSETYIITGNAPGAVAADTSGVSNKINTTQNIITSNGVGDINGDGFDDFAISLQDGNDVSTYVVYGQTSAFGTINDTFLNNTNNALKITHENVLNPGNYQITAVGDVNGDGFDDVQVGVQGGPQFVVRGNFDGTTNYVTDGSVGDNLPSTVGQIEASGAGQSLIGNVNFTDGDHASLSMRGGSGNNNFGIQRSDFLSIDGGSGTDTIRYGDTGFTLDFTNVNFEAVSQVERLHFSQNGATIRLTAENIFNLLKSSDDGSLTIGFGSTGGTLATNGTLEIVNDSGSIDIPSTLQNNSPDASVATSTENIGGEIFDHFQIGGYNLYVDQDVTVAIV